MQINNEQKPFKHLRNMRKLLIISIVLPFLILGGCSSDEDPTSKVPEFCYNSVVTTWEMDPDYVFLSIVDSPKFDERYPYLKIVVVKKQDFPYQKYSDGTGVSFSIIKELSYYTYKGSPLSAPASICSIKICE